MQRIKLDHKTGFQNLEPGLPVIIHDNRNIPFYDSRFLRNAVPYFNLPAGKYKIVSGNFIPTSKPYPFEKFILPPPEWHRKSPENFQVVFEPNEHKALVDWKGKRIVFDDSFLNRPLPQVMFIFWHEVGHKNYGGHMPGSEKYDRSEHYCDMFAHNQMIDEGYNPSQIGMSPLDTLSDKQLKKRKAKLINKMSKL